MEFYRRKLWQFFAAGLVFILLGLIAIRIVVFKREQVPTLSASLVSWQLANLFQQEPRPRGLLMGDLTCLTGLVPKYFEKAFGIPVANVGGVGQNWPSAEVEIIETYLEEISNLDYVVYHVFAGRLNDDRDPRRISLPFEVIAARRWLNQSYRINLMKENSGYLPRLTESDATALAAAPRIGPDLGAFEKYRLAKLFELSEQNSFLLFVVVAPLPEHIRQEPETLQNLATLKTQLRAWARPYDRVHVYGPKFIARDGFRTPTELTLSGARENFKLLKKQFARHLERIEKNPSGL